MWQIESLRLTAFTVSPILSATEWWKQLTGEDPANRTQRPREAFWQDEGPVALPSGVNSTLRLSINPLRVDWRMVTSDVPLPLPNLGEFPKAANPFLDYVNRWLRISPEITRIAFGASLLLPVESLEAGLQTLNDYLPFGLSGSERDFVYRINRPRTFKLEDEELTLNRISTWSVIQTGTFVLAVPPLAAESNMETETVACKLELDINNAPRVESLSAPNRIALLAELFELALEIASEGDKP